MMSKSFAHHVRVDTVLVLVLSSIRQFVQHEMMEKGVQRSHLYLVVPRLNLGGELKGLVRL